MSMCYNQKIILRITSAKVHRNLKSQNLHTKSGMCAYETIYLDCMKSIFIVQIKELYP